MKCTDCCDCDDTLAAVPHGIVAINPDAPATRMKSKRLVMRFILAVGQNKIWLQQFLTAQQVIPFEGYLRNKFNDFF